MHATSLASVSDGYHNFLLRFDRTRKVVYGFVEGKDDPAFYRGVIERFIPDDWSVDLIRSGNRNKVLSCEEEFDWNRFSREQICFFVDRDLTDFTAQGAEYAPNVYVTDGYSIENDIATPDVFLRLLSEVFNVVDWTPEERQNMSHHFSAQREVFCNSMNGIMAQILFWRRNSIKANLNNLDLSSIFHVEGGWVGVRAGFEDCEARVDRLCECVGAPKANAAALSEMEADFVAADGPAKLVRGKYLIWFLASAVNEIHQSIDNFVNSYHRPPKSKLSVGTNNVMVVAAPRARIPASLREFIEAGFLRFIEARDAR